MTAAWGAVLVAAITPVVALLSNLLGIWFGKRLERSGERERPLHQLHVVDRWGWASIAAAVVTAVVVASLAGTVVAWIAGGVVSIGWGGGVVCWGLRRKPLLSTEVATWLRSSRLFDSPRGGHSYRQEPAGLVERTYTVQNLSLVDDVQTGGLRDSDHRVVLTPDELLASGVHVLVTGEAGVGKSTNLRHFGSVPAQRFWAEATRRTVFASKHSPKWFPLLLAARELAERASIEAALESAPAGMLTRPPFRGGEWLVLVDAMDEVLNNDQRQQVWELLLEAVRTDGPCRFVISSRSVDSTRWRDLQYRGVAHYQLHPFTDEQLLTFAVRHQSGRAEPNGSERIELEQRAKAFIDHVRDKGLIEVVRLPLLAKLAADLYFDYRNRDLPMRRVDLYEHSIAQWLGKFDATLETEVLRGVPERERDDVHKLLANLEQRYGAAGAEMLRRFLTDLFISDERVNGVAAPMTDVAAKLLGVASTAVAPATKLAVGRVLEATGLIRDPYHDARFWHLTFGGYLAAEMIEDQILEDPDRLVHLLSEPEDHTMSIFAFHHLNEARKNQVIAKLTGSPRHLRFAAVLVAEGLCSDSVAEDVVTDLWTCQPEWMGRIPVSRQTSTDWWQAVDSLRGHSVLNRFLTDVCAQDKAPNRDSLFASVILIRHGREDLIPAECVDRR